MAQWVSQWVSEWQGHLLSCSGQLKTYMTTLAECHIIDPSSLAIRHMGLTPRGRWHCPSHHWNAALHKNSDIEYWWGKKRNDYYCHWERYWILSGQQGCVSRILIVFPPLPTKFFSIFFTTFFSIFPTTFFSIFIPLVICKRMDSILRMFICFLLLLHFHSLFSSASRHHIQHLAQLCITNTNI